MPQPLALVPTMGALHEGHLELLRAARAKVGPKGTVAISIFVNPIQFDQAADLENYPQPLEEDLALCEAVGVDLAFIPEKETLYQGDHSVLIRETLLTKHLCGATRPGHFDGVLTIVLKLFNILQPDFAIFGKKDFQQLALIHRMVRDLDLPSRSSGTPPYAQKMASPSLPEIRDLSHRNDPMPPASGAPCSPPATSVSLANKTPRSIYAPLAATLLADAPASFSIDYLELVDAETLQPVSTVTKPSFLATACFYGEVRLIDHITL